MKRLLIYLFVILGLGLSLNVKEGTAAIIQVCDKSYDYDQSQKFSNIYVGFYKSEKIFLKHRNISGYCTEYYKKDSKEIYEQLKELVKDQISKSYIGRHGTSMIIASYQYSDFIERNNLKYLNLEDDQVVFGYERMSKDVFCNQVKKLNQNAWGYPKHKVEKYCYPKTLTKKQTQVAKTEPNQTQKVVNKEFYDVRFCHPKNSKPLSATTTVWANIVGEKPIDKCFENEAKFEDIYNYKELSICLSRSEFSKNKFFGQVTPVSCSAIGFPLIVKYDGERFYTEKETQFAKAETNQKEELEKEKGITTKVVKKEEKKKQNKKVVKKQEAPQEEFKPKKANQDNEPPVIKISNSFTVNDANYEISGFVTDESNRIFIEVDGQTIQAKKGKFTIKRYSPIDEQIQIVAIDNWGNKSEPQIVDIIIDTEVKQVTDNIEPLNPNKIRAKSNSNKVALIIGIEEYKQTPAASYANLDAKFFYEYARKGFGVSKNNIKILIDEDANLISSLGTLKKWLPGKIKSNQTELIVFFAGHGLASSNGEELYLLPQDSDPDLLERTALSRNELFETIIRLNPKNVTMFFDTCFSGISRDEKTLLASARPIRIIASEEQDIPDNFTIFSASQLDQISSGIKEAKHGIFSYYLMKGLEGYADVNKDKKITNGELLAYMDENVSQKASELGRQQNPSLVGDPNKVLSKY